MKIKAQTKIFTALTFLLLSSFSAYPQANSLEGIWILSFLHEDGKDVPLEFYVPTKKFFRVEMAFTKDAFGFNSSCNKKSGNYTVQEDEKLKFTSLRSTLMRCRGGADKVEKSYVTALFKATKYQVKDKVLILQDDTGKNVLKFNYLNPMFPQLERYYGISPKD